MLANHVEPGVLYGVGAGPGDPELITVKAARVLAEVDLIFLPGGVQSGGSFVRRIVEPLNLRPEKFRPVSLCMSRDREDDISAYDRAARNIVEELQRGKSVAWLTEGDPLFYSTFLHIYEAAKRFGAKRIEIIPGVSSAGAAAARCQIPAARLDDRVAVVPAYYGIQGLAALLDQFETVFLLKVNSVFEQLLSELALVRFPIRAVYLEKIGAAEERVVTDLESLRGQKLSYFALVMIRREKTQ